MNAQLLPPPLPGVITPGAQLVWIAPGSQLAQQSLPPGWYLVIGGMLGPFDPAVGDSPAGPWAAPAPAPPVEPMAANLQRARCPYHSGDAPSAMSCTCDDQPP